MFHDDGSEITSVSFKPVPFIQHDPEVWFATLEHQFVARRVTSQKQKFAFALEALPGVQLATMRDIILIPPEDEPYGKLKDAILQQFLPSREERLRSLLSRNPIGDAKPTGHLKHLRQLAGPTHAQSEIVRELWLESLPMTVQPTVTAILETESLDKAAIIADKILARLRNSDHPLIASTMRVQSVDLDKRPHPRDTASCIHRRLSFKDRVQVPHGYPRQAVKRTATARRTKSSTRSGSCPPESKSQDGLCWFHKHYGANARRCRAPCSYVAGKANPGD